MKRAFDLVAATVGVCVFGPLWVPVAVAIKLEDGGSVLFVQERLGRDRVPIRVHKLRTMRDGRVTRVGRWLRATGIDETAQFLDVLRGTMSMVGPRPLTAEDVERLGWTESARFATKPGITGPAQVFGGRGAEVSEQLEARYAKDASLRVDLEMVVLSFGVNVLGKARVRRWLAGHRYATPSKDGWAGEAERVMLRP
ncbi:MAG: sugar transferase [Alphaproteobacteria bacterium]|nr:sugar transferase [Alphaproteobacteria bacterium]